MESEHMLPCPRVCGEGAYLKSQWIPHLLWASDQTRKLIVISAGSRWKRSLQECKDRHLSKHSIRGGWWYPRLRVVSTTSALERSRIHFGLNDLDNLDITSVSFDHVTSINWAPSRMFKQKYILGTPSLSPELYKWKLYSTQEVKGLVILAAKSMFQPLY